MKHEDKQAIRDAIEATELHRTVLQNNLKARARVCNSTLADLVDGMAITISKLEAVVGKAEAKRRSRIFIVSPNGQNDEDTRHDVCSTSSRLPLADVYGADLYEVLGERQSLQAAKRLAIKLGAKRPAII